MTTQREMEMAYKAQQQVIVALRSIGEPDLADRLAGCMTARRERHYGDGWPRTCRSAACVWCRRAMIRGWWNGMCQWSAEAATSSLAIIPVYSPEGLHSAVRRLRRSLRDVRDRIARHRRSWREVCVAGMTGGDGRVLAMITHEGIDRHEVEAVLRRQWPNAVVKELEQEQPAVAMSPGDAGDLGRSHRGVEPRRIVIMPQQDRQTITSPIVEPIPVVVMGDLHNRPGPHHRLL